MVIGIFHELSSCYGKKKFDHLSSTSGSASNFVLFFQLYLEAKHKEKQKLDVLIGRLGYFIVTKYSMLWSPSPLTKVYFSLIKNSTYVLREAFLIFRDTS